MLSYLLIHMTNFTQDIKKCCVARIYNDLKQQIYQNTGLKIYIIFLYLFFPIRYIVIIYSLV